MEFEISAGIKKWSNLRLYRLQITKPTDNQEKLSHNIIDEVLYSLGDSSIFSIFDATSGYHQIRMEELDIPKTAFTYKRNQYEFVRMPFGLCNAPLTFQKIMESILKDEEDVLVYLDDIILKSKMIDDHKILIDRILYKLKAAGIILNKKCKLFCKEQGLDFGWDF